MIKMKLIQTWFSFRGCLKWFDFILKGFAPGILLGVVAMRADAAFDARGMVVFPFLAFSLWPASAMLWKLARQRRREVPDKAVPPNVFPRPA